MFEDDKKKFLSKKGKIRKSDIDENIKGLVSAINKHINFYTISSCSGEIAIIEKKSTKKNASKLLYASHDAVKYMPIWKVVEDLPKNDVWIRSKPMIMHVSCRSIDHAQELVVLAKECGFKRTGIYSTKRKIHVEIGGTDYINTIIGRKGDLLIDGSYLKVLITEANKKMTHNLKKIQKFEKEFKKIL